MPSKPPTHYSPEEVKQIYGWCCLAASLLHQPEMLDERLRWLATLDARDRRIAELVAALKGVLSLIDSGQLRRDTSNDANPDWAMRQIPFVKALAAAQEAIDAAIEKGTGI